MREVLTMLGLRRNCRVSRTLGATLVRAQTTIPDQSLACGPPLEVGGALTACSLLDGEAGDLEAVFVRTHHHFQIDGHAGCQRVDRVEGRSTHAPESIQNVLGERPAAAPQKHAAGSPAHGKSHRDDVGSDTRTQGGESARCRGRSAGGPYNVITKFEMVAFVV